MKLFQLNPRNHYLTFEVETNLKTLFDKLSLLESRCPPALCPFVITSGYRTKEEQLQINPKSPNSHHCHGLAVDISDRELKLFHFLANNITLLSSLKLFMEDTTLATVKHLHLQLVAPHSGNIIFEP